MLGQAPIWVPILNTSLILVSGVFLLVGYYFIRHKEIALHRRCMLTATTFAGLFLVVYVSRAVLFETQLFAGEGLMRAVYLAILGSHVILAIILGPLVLVVLYRALREEFKRHRRLARVTLPMWLYVVATGWMIFGMLHWL